jgi:hypothetical protein
MAPRMGRGKHDFLRSFRSWALLRKSKILTLLGSADAARRDFSLAFHTWTRSLFTFFSDADKAKHDFWRSFRSWARPRRTQILTLLGAIAVISVCVLLLLTAGPARVWIGPLAAALLTVAMLAVIWEVHWKHSLVEGVFLRFNPPAKGHASDRFFSPITLFSYEQAKEICQCGPEKMNLTLICAENARVEMQKIKLSIDLDAFEFIAEIRENEKITKAVVQVKLAFDAITQKLRPLADGQVVSPILDALKSVPDFLEKLSSLMTSAIIPLAHYLSSSDQAKQLREINRKLDLLHEYRSLEQEAKLKAVYQQAAEVLSSQGPIYATERFDTPKLALRQLQNIWIKEIQLHLEIAPDVRGAFFKKRAEKRFCENLLPLAPKLQLFQLAFFTDLCLADATGTLREFRAVTVKDHVTEFKQISTRCAELVARLERKDIPNYVHVQAIQDATAVLRRFLESVENFGPEKRISAKARGA